MKAKRTCLSMILILAVCSCFISGGCTQDTSNDEPEQLQAATQEPVVEDRNNQL